LFLELEVSVYSTNLKQIFRIKTFKKIVLRSLLGLLILLLVSGILLSLPAVQTKLG